MSYYDQTYNVRFSEYKEIEEYSENNKEKIIEELIDIQDTITQLVYRIQEILPDHLREKAYSSWIVQINEALEYTNPDLDGYTLRDTIDEIRGKVEIEY